MDVAGQPGNAEGITRDLEQMKAKGIGGAIVMSVGERIDGERAERRGASEGGGSHAEHGNQGLIGTVPRGRSS